MRRPDEFAQINSSYYTASVRGLQGENKRMEMHKTVKKAPFCAILWYTGCDMHKKDIRRLCPKAGLAAGKRG